MIDDSGPEPVDPAEDDGGAAARGSIERTTAAGDRLSFSAERITFRPLVTDGPGTRSVNPDDPADLRAWGSTVAYLLESGRMAHPDMSDLDRRAVIAWRSQMDPVTEVYSRALYDAARVDLGDLIPEWTALSEHSRETYRRQGAYVRSAVEAASAPAVQHYQRGVSRRVPSDGVAVWGSLSVGQRAEAEVSGHGRVPGVITSLHPSWGRDGMVAITPDDLAAADGADFISCVPSQVTIFGGEAVGGEG